MSVFDVVIMDCIPNKFKESFGNCFQTKSLDSSMLQMYIANDGTIYGLPDQSKYFVGEVTFYNDKTLEKNIQLKGFVYCGLLLYLMSDKDILFTHPGLQYLIPQHG